jgi:hypothetical protein
MFVLFVCVCLCVCVCVCVCVCEREREREREREIVCVRESLRVLTKLLSTLIFAAIAIAAMVVGNAK